MVHADALSRNPVSEAVENTHVLDVLTVGSEDWITTVQTVDEEINRIKAILSDPSAEDVADIIKNYKLKNGKVFRITGNNCSDLRWVVPKGVRWQIVKINHDDLGHFGFEKTLNRIQQSFWFPKMRRFIKKYVQSCLECAYHKGVTGKQEGELHPIPKTEIPFHTVHADHLGPFVRSIRGNTYLLVIVDGFTKFVNITPVRDTKTSNSIKVLKEHISYFGTPTRLITDRGTSFTSNSFKTFVKSLGIKHILNAVSTPRANGQVERFNRSILEALSSKCSDKNDRRWDEYIYNIQLGLNTTIHKTTGKSSSEIVFGFKINSGTENILNDVIIETICSPTVEKFREIRSDVGKRISDQQAKDKERFDVKRKPSHIYTEGDLVSVKRDLPSDGQSMKLAAKYQGPYRIAKLLPNERFVVKDTPLTKKKGHSYDNVVAIDKIKPWLNFTKDFGSSSESESESANDHKSEFT
jgi:transposase InsO family protein